MITGRVNESLEAVIVLTIQGRGELPADIEVTIDTGFNGHLTLPRSLIQQLDMEWIDSGKALLADGSEQLFDLYRGVMAWEHAQLLVDVECAEMTPLLGMAVLEGSRITIDVRANGRVEIERLPFA